MTKQEKEKRKKKAAQRTEAQKFQEFRDRSSSSSAGSNTRRRIEPQRVRSLPLSKKAHTQEHDTLSEGQSVWYRNHKAEVIFVIQQPNRILADADPFYYKIKLLTPQGHSGGAIVTVTRGELTKRSGAGENKTKPSPDAAKQKAKKARHEKLYSNLRF